MILLDQNNCDANTLLLAIKRTGTSVSMLPTVAGQRRLCGMRSHS